MIHYQNQKYSQSSKLQIKSGFVIVFLLSVFSCTPKDKGKVRTDIDWSSFMAAQDLVWDSLLPSNTSCAPFLGNGLIDVTMQSPGFSDFQHRSNQLIFEIERTDMLDSNMLSEIENFSLRPQPGHFVLKLNGNIRSYKFRLDLWNAELDGTVETDSGQVIIKSFVHAALPVLVMEVSYSGHERTPEWNYIPDTVGNDRLTGAPGLHRSSASTSSPFARMENYQNIRTYHQGLKSGQEFAVGWTSLKAKNRINWVSTIAYSNPGAAPQFDAVELLRKVVAINFQSLQESHQRWWHRFYTKSFVSLPDARFEKFFWVQQYLTGSTLRKNQLLADFPGTNMHQKGLYTIRWSGYAQAMYAQLFTSNYLEGITPLVKSMQRYQENLILNTPEEIRYNASALNQTSSYNLLSPLEPVIAGPMKYCYICGNLTSVMFVLQQYYRYSMDEKTLREVVYPLLRRSINLYLDIMKKGADGHYHLPLTCTPEYLYAADCNYDLALFHWGCKALITIAGELQINDTLLPVWQDVMHRLTPYAADSNGIMVGKDVSMHADFPNFSNLQMIFPLHDLDIENIEDQALIERTLNYRATDYKVPSGWLYSISSAMYTAAGKGNEALAQLNKAIPSLAFSGSTSIDNEGAEPPYMAMQALQEMLLQSWDNTIRIFPAVPDTWKDISFDKLRAEGAFLVSAIRKEGKTQFVSINSLAGKTCFVRTDIPTDSIQTESKIPVRVSIVDKFTLKVFIPKGESLVIYPRGGNPRLVLTVADKDDPR
jgi:alpha-L-fucosidase 2